MNESKRPTMSISLKPVGGNKEDRLYLLAGWERDGKLTSLALDRKIKHGPVDDAPAEPSPEGQRA